jgi:hypothetical protein
MGLTGGESLPALGHLRWGKGLVQIPPGSSSFQVGGPSPSVRSGGAISSMGYLVPQPLAAGGNWVISRFVGP